MNRDDRRASKRAAQAAERVEATAAPVKTKRTGPAQFLKEVRQELRKVNWPSRSEVVSYTAVVLVTTAVLTAIVWGVDWLISNAVLNVFG
jgi:preprotein translocase subunit SecE